MTKTLYLRDLLLDTLKAYNVYANEAPEDAQYPYAVIQLRPYNTDRMPQDGVLEINTWDSYKTYSRVDALMDNIEETIKDGQLFVDNEHHVSFRCFKGQRQIVEDSDKHIKRIREQFSIRFTM